MKTGMKTINNLSTKKLLRSVRTEQLLLFLQQRQNPRFYRGNKKALVKIKSGEQRQATKTKRKEITSEYNRSGLAAALLKYRRLKT